MVFRCPTNGFSERSTDIVCAATSIFSCALLSATMNLMELRYDDKMSSCCSVIDDIPLCSDDRLPCVSPIIPSNDLKNVSNCELSSGRSSFIMFAHDVISPSDRLSSSPTYCCSAFSHWSTNLPAILIAACRFTRLSIMSSNSSSRPLIPSPVSLNASYHASTNVSEALSTSSIIPAVTFENIPFSMSASWLSISASVSYISCSSFHSSLPTSSAPLRCF